MEFINTRVPLWKVTVWDKKFKDVEKEWQPNVVKYKYFLADELDNLKVENGDVRILYTGKEIAYTTREKAGEDIATGEIVAIPWGGIPKVTYYKGDFITGDNRIATSSDTSILDNKYLYYFMNSRISELSSYYRGASIKHPSMKSVLNMQINIPSLIVQQKIISIFDKINLVIEFYNKELSLLDEIIEAKFYEMFGDPILKTDGHKFKDCTNELIRGPFGSSLKKEFFVSDSEDAYKVYEQKHAIEDNEEIGRYYISDNKFSKLKRFALRTGDIIMSCSGTIGKIHIMSNNFKKGIINQALLLIRLNHNVCNELFFKYQMKFIIEKLQTSGSAITNISSIKILSNMDFLLPKIEQQLEFAKFIKNIEKIKVNIKKQLKITQELLEKKKDKFFGGNI